MNNRKDTKLSSTATSITNPQPKRKRKLHTNGKITLTVCLSILLFFFVFLYLIGLFILLPSASSSNSDLNLEESAVHKSKIGRINVKNLVKSAFKREPSKAEFLFEQVQQEFQQNQNMLKHAIPALIPEKKVLPEALKISPRKPVVPPEGVIVLGMHRSGTSMLSGLLVKGFGYETGGPLIGQNFDNKKGFFERVDIVLQNDEFLGKQRAGWDFNVAKFDYKKALEHKASGKVEFKKGAKGLDFLNNVEHSPWLQKDPRMCITLKVWIGLFNTPPAILFTYRHPLQVAKSLRKRNKQEGFPPFPLDKGFRLWILYNKMAILNSEDLCIVHTSNDAVLADAQKEVQRVSDELTSKCLLKAPPKKKIRKPIVNEFVDASLQGKKDEGALLTKFDDCPVYDYEREYKDTTSEEYIRENDLYLIAMKIFCDFESGVAYRKDYGWPTLP